MTDTIEPKILEAVTPQCVLALTWTLSDAQGEVLVEIQCHGRRYHGKAVSTDIVEASALAYLKALNKAVARMNAEQPTK